MFANETNIGGNAMSNRLFQGAKYQPPNNVSMLIINLLGFL